MKSKRAAAVFVMICGLDAVLLLTHVISVVVGACLFAGALVLLGSFSKGFRRAREER